MGAQVPGEGNAAVETDVVLPFQVDGLGVRGRLVRLGPALKAALIRHNYPVSVSNLMGEVMALAAVLASSLKYDGIFTLQIQSDGPVNLLFADLTSEGVLRGYARFDAEKVAAADDGDGAQVPRYIGAGHMAFTVDQGPDTDRYQGITPLEGATLTDCANDYFRHSEQLATSVMLASDSNMSGALMVQRLPAEGGDAIDRTDEDWRRAVILMGSMTGAELLDPALMPQDLLYRLYHEDGTRIFDSSALRHGCRCSDQKVERTLKSFPEAEVAELAEDGVVTVTCEFCKTDYVFDEAQVAQLFADKTGG